MEGASVSLRSHVAGILVFTFTSFSFAGIQITGVSNASSYDNLNYSEIVIYGGTAGGLTGDCASPSSLSSTCNNCLDTDANGEVTSACNLNRILPTTLLTITFKFVSGANPTKTSTTDTSPTSTTPTSGGVGTFGRPILAKATGGAQISNSQSSVPLLSVGQTASITVPWKHICESFTTGMSSNCETDATEQKTFLLGIDRNGDGILDSNDTDKLPFTIEVRHTMDATSDFCGDISNPPAQTKGICSFRVTAGDKRIYLQDFLGDTSTTFRAIRLYLAEGDDIATMVDKATIENQFKTLKIGPKSDFAELSIDQGANTGDAPSVNPTSITSLDNDRSYYIKAAAVDQAMNVGYFTKVADSARCSADPADLDCHYAKTGEILGVLAKDTNCFVATAALGSPLYRSISYLRQFRSHYLMKTDWGEKFVGLYYTYGPFWAKKIVDHPQIKPLVHILLLPFIGFAALTIEMGLTTALFVYGLLLATIIFGCFRLRRLFANSRVDNEI